ncbi:MAG: ribosome maturation factor RimP [Beutenbergiaceae bacterium]
MATDIASQLHTVLDPVVTDAGLLLEDVAVTGPAGRRVVRVMVDLLDGPGGVGSDHLGEVSRAVSQALDAVDESLQGAYLLEVTTPGVDRPLTQPRHFRRAQGRLVCIQTADSKVTGRVEGVAGGLLRLKVEQPRGGSCAVEVPLTDIENARIEVELRRSAESE